MPLDSGGRVLLKIFNSQKELLVSRPCISFKIAQEWLEEYRNRNPRVHLEIEITEMVPRI